MAPSSPENSVESKKPKNTPFSQQQLPAWQPILTAGTVLPTFFVIGIAFLAIGIGLLYFSNEVLEKSIDYTDCKDAAGLMCADVIANDTKKPCDCVVPFKLEDGWSKPVYMYYGLTNFYQNHRRYVKSRDEKQLLGEITSTPNTDCNPYDVDADSKKPIVPCGAIANSLFNGIAWASDKKYKFKNPALPPGYATLKDYLQNVTVSPKDWHVNLWELDLENPENNGLQNEDLIVWMRTAAFPNFRKLYRIINHEISPFTDGLPAGDYTLNIDYNYRVKQFSGTKSVILAQTSVLGGKNPFLGIAYIVVGSVCIVIGIVFLFIHIKYGKLTSEMMDMGGGRG